MTVVNCFHLCSCGCELKTEANLHSIVIVVVVIVIVTAPAAAVIVVISGGGCDDDSDTFHEDWIRLVPDNVDSLHICNQWPCSVLWLFQR